MSEKPLPNRELREAEIHLTGERPAATGIIGFVPDLPADYTPLSQQQAAENSGPPPPPEPAADDS